MQLFRLIFCVLEQLVRIIFRLSLNPKSVYPIILIEKYRSSWRANGHDERGKEKQIDQIDVIY